MKIFKSKGALCSLFLAFGLSSVNTAQADYCYSNQSFTDTNASNQPSNAANTSDAEIAKKVREKLSAGWFTKGYDQVDVQVNNGNVTLSGSIPSWDDKEKVEKDIRSIDGVKGLSLRLNVQDTESKDNQKNTSDQEIAKNIRDKISSGWFAKGFDQVNVQVNNGNVTLQGFVKTQDDKEKVEKEVRNVQGVKNVNNQIVVQQGNDTAYNDDNTMASTKAISDQDLAKKINDKLHSGWFSRGYDQVTADVNNGVVTLQGSVKTWADKEKVEKEIRDMDGVRKLNSGIDVQDLTSRGKQTDFQLDRAATAADDQLNKKIRDQVSRGWLWNDYKDVKLNTSNGVVTLEGNVDDLKDQQKLMTEVQKVEGVQAVKSDLRVKNNQ